MLNSKGTHDVIEILLVEDDEGEVRLTKEVLKESNVSNRVSVAYDGVDALAFLHREPPHCNAPRPHLILLDLNMPRKSGRCVLAEIKQDPELRRIPVVVLTTSNAEQDVVQCYELHANCYIEKPVDFDHFVAVVRSIEDFWLTRVRRP